MLSSFFQTGPLPNNAYVGFYDIGLVLLSFLVATSASYIALDLTARLRDINNTQRSRLYWLIGGSVAMGAGIWSMHFIGMLSFTIPGLQLRYDPFWTFLSLLVAILASGFALILLQTNRIKIEQYIAGGVILGLAIASMHYTGMQGLLISLNIRYLPFLFFLSILVAIVASEAALWLALKSTRVVIRSRNKIKLVSAVIMGAAICGMHYIGMTASVFTPLCSPSSIIATTGIDQKLLAIGIAVVTFVILGIAFITSAYKDSINQQQLEKARQLGMAELSASVLHNVGNVLNSVNVSANVIVEKMQNLRFNDLNLVHGVLVENKNNFSEFMQGSRGTKTIEYLSLLAEHLENERTTILNEMAHLNKQVSMIKDIISTQQSLSKTTFMEELVNIEELLDETVLITGLSYKSNIKINKEYSNILPIKIDKVKLLQVLVNLLKNAKDAVLESKKTDKVIAVKTFMNPKNKLIIEIIDNGIGILPGNINKIFNYGFTSKLSGHGFGLHTTAIYINELGGSIAVKSEGLENGAHFTIELPFKN